jgi:hypothetical protein
MTRRFLSVLALVVAIGPAGAQPVKPAGTATTETARGEATVLVPPQGGTADVPVHATANLLLTFPTPIAPRLLTSGRDWDIKEFVDGVAVRALSEKAAPMTLALATKDGQIKVNITLRVVPPSADALTLVRFQAASAEDAFKAAVEAEVEQRTAPMRAELARANQALDAKVRERADAMVARRLLERLEETRLKAHERNDDNVIVHVTRAVFLGPDAYLFFDIENRSGSAYRLAKVSVLGPRKSNHAGPASVLSSAIDQPEAGVIGVVAAGSTGKAVVVLRQVDAVLGAPLALVIEQPEGRGKVVVDRGITLR